MKVLFDVSILGYSLLNQQYRTGIYRVAVALLRALAKRPELELIGYSSSGNQLLARQALAKEGLKAIPVRGSLVWASLAFWLILARNVTHRLGLRLVARGLTRLNSWAQ